MQVEDPKDIYSSMITVWPENDRWYDYTHKCILRFVETHMTPLLTEKNIYLNAGSGGSEYNIPGICHHVDIAENLISKFDKFTVASIEDLPMQNNVFDAVVCVGSVINYCDAVKSITEMTRVLKPGGYLVLEFERSNTGELLFTSEYGKTISMQQYDYMGHIHTLWLYSEHFINQVLHECGMKTIRNSRFHCLSAVANRITHNEEHSGQFAHYDRWIKPLSYLLAHNTIVLCRKL